MAPDSDDEWLAELLAPPPKRRRDSEDDAAALVFLCDLLKGDRPTTAIGMASLSSTQDALSISGFALNSARNSLPAANVRLVPADVTTATIANVHHVVTVESTNRAGPKSATQAVALSKRDRLTNVIFRLPQSNKSGTILAHAEDIVQTIVKQGPTIFKIGITTDPSHRWTNNRYGYLHDSDNYQQMVVFF